jgi:hypothetical protein
MARFAQLSQSVGSRQNWRIQKSIRIPLYSVSRKIDHQIRRFVTLKKVVIFANPKVVLTPTALTLASTICQPVQVNTVRETPTITLRL